MSKKTDRRSSKGLTLEAADEKNFVALTVKIDRRMYQRLLSLRATGEKPRTHQDILRQALQEYLDRTTG